MTAGEATKAQEIEKTSWTKLTTIEGENSEPSSPHLIDDTDKYSQTYLKSLSQHNRMTDLPSILGHRLPVQM